MLLSFVFLISIISAALADLSLNVSDLTAGDPTFFKADPEVLSLNLNATSYGWTEYKQCDSRWSSEQLGTCSSTTICSAGCAMSSVAMILATKGCSYTPSTLNSWLKSHSGKKLSNKHICIYTIFLNGRVCEWL